MDDREHGTQAEDLKPHVDEAPAYEEDAPEARDAIPSTAQGPECKPVTRGQEAREFAVNYFKVTLRIIEVFIVVAAIAVLVSTLVMPVLQVSGASMVPTLANKDIVVLLASDKPARGQVFGMYWENKILVKRIIGLPGDTVSITDDGVVYVNGEMLDEPYAVDRGKGESDVVFPYKVPEGNYFVLGDMRSVSIDSRTTTVGCVAEDQVIGRVVFRVWPFGSFGPIG